MEHPELIDQVGRRGLGIGLVSGNDFRKSIRVETLDLDHMTPLDAMTLLAELQEKTRV